MKPTTTTNNNTTKTTPTPRLHPDAYLPDALDPIDDTPAPASHPTHTSTPAPPPAQNPHLNLQPHHIPGQPITPIAQWQHNTYKAIPKHHRQDFPNPIHATHAIEKGQPHRQAQEAARDTNTPLPPTHGPLMLPESYDILNNPSPTPPPLPKTTITPTTPAPQVLHAAAHDLATVISVLSARLRHSIGFEPDTHTITKISELAFSLSKLHYILQQTPTPKRPPGRPRKLPK